jgi:hypothetical protein
LTFANPPPKAEVSGMETVSANKVEVLFAAISCGSILCKIQRRHTYWELDGRGLKIPHLRNMSSLKETADERGCSMSRKGRMCKLDGSLYAENHGCEKGLLSFKIVAVFKEI